MKIKDFIFRLFGYQKRVLLGLDGTAKEKYIKTQKPIFRLVFFNFVNMILDWVRSKMAPPPTVKMSKKAIEYATSPTCPKYRIGHIVTGFEEPKEENKQ